MNEWINEWLLRTVVNLQKKVQLALKEEVKFSLWSIIVEPLNHTVFLINFLFLEQCVCDIYLLTNFNIPELYEGFVS